MLREVTPSSVAREVAQEAESPLKGRIGLDDLVDSDAFERLRGLIPVQPGDKSRVWGVNSFAAFRCSRVRVVEMWRSHVGTACRSRRDRKGFPL